MWAVWNNVTLLMGSGKRKECFSLNPGHVTSSCCITWPLHSITWLLRAPNGNLPTNTIWISIKLSKRPARSRDKAGRASIDLFNAPIVSLDGLRRVCCHRSTQISHFQVFTVQIIDLVRQEYVWRALGQEFTMRGYDKTDTILFSVACWF